MLSAGATRLLNAEMLLACARKLNRRPANRYKYIHMEEMLGNVAGARQIFERWMKWEPDHNGWAAYIKVSPGL